MVEESIDEKLWGVAQILAEENRLEEVETVIHSIASHVVGRYSGKPLEEVVLKPISKKEFKVDHLISMKALSKEVSLLVENQQYERAQEKIFEYIDEIVSLLSSSYEEEKRLRRSFLKNLIQFSVKTQRNNGLSNSSPYRLSHANVDIVPQGTIFSHPVTAAVETYTTSEAAEILNISDQTIRRMCEAGKFPGASRTDGGHWRIPREHFNVTIEQSRQINEDLADIRKKSDEGGQVDEFDL